MLKNRLAGYALFLGMLALGSPSTFAMGPVTHSAVENQGSAGFCWSYAMAGLIEGEMLKQGKQVTLSPEYLGFYHILFQIQSKLTDYRDLARIHSQLLKPLIDDLIKDLLDPSTGNQMTVALGELKLAGAVPESFFTHKFNDNEDPDLDDRLTAFAETNLLDSDKLSSYMDNSQTLVNDLAAVYGATPPKTTDTFQYEGVTYTPITFLTNYLKFDPDHYQEVPNNQLGDAQSLALIEKVLDANIQVPIGFEVLNDLKTVQSTGYFDTKNCATSSCMAVGGHEVLAIGTEDSPTGAVYNLIIKNSWGHLGLNDLAQSPDSRMDLGFFVIMNDYFDNPQFPWSFVIPKSYLNQ